MFESFSSTFLSVFVGLLVLVAFVSGILGLLIFMFGDNAVFVFLSLVAVVGLGLMGREVAKRIKH